MKDESIYIKHMLECITHVETCLGKGEELFKYDPIIRGAALRYLQELAESAKYIPDEIKRQTPELNWSKLIGFRSVLVHDYLGIDMGIVYRAAVNRLPPIKAVSINYTNKKGML